MQRKLNCSMEMELFHGTGHNRSFRETEVEIQINVRQDTKGKARPACKIIYACICKT